LPCAERRSNPLLGLLIRKFFSIIAYIWMSLFENFGLMASGRRRPEDEFR
jgi:hypothetical protein